MAGQVIWLGNHFEKGVFSGGPYLLMQWLLTCAELPLVGNYKGCMLVISLFVEHAIFFRLR